MRFVASDESVDRYGDIIRASGWQLDNFRKNPVLLFAHDFAPASGRPGAEHRSRGDGADRRLPVPA